MAPVGAGGSCAPRARPDSLPSAAPGPGCPGPAHSPAASPWAGKQQVKRCGEIPLLNGGIGFGFQSEVHVLMPRTCGSGKGDAAGMVREGTGGGSDHVTPGALGEQEAHRK